MNFSEKFCVLRGNSGYSQEQIAEKIGVSRQAVSKWEAGEALPETSKMVAISEVFGVSIDFLLKEDAIVDTVSNNLDRVIFKFLGSTQQMDAISKELIAIMQDGIIDDNEKISLVSIMDTLDELVKIIDEIKIRVKL